MFRKPPNAPFTVCDAFVDCVTSLKTIVLLKILHYVSTHLGFVWKTFCGFLIDYDTSGNLAGCGAWFSSVISST